MDDKMIPKYDEQHDLIKKKLDAAILKPIKLKFNKSPQSFQPTNKINKNLGTNVI